MLSRLKIYYDLRQLTYESPHITLVVCDVWRSPLSEYRLIHPNSKMYLFESFGKVELESNVNAFVPYEFAILLRSLLEQTPIEMDVRNSAKKLSEAPCADV